MEKNYLLKSSKKNAHLARLIAKCIDLFIVMILAVFFYPIGIIFGGIYLGLSDSFAGGQSVGKKFIGFRVISIEDGEPCDVKKSLIRNLPFLVSMAPSIIPFWGWLISLLVGVPIVALELYLLFRLDSGNRLGDVMADTTVVTMVNDPLKEKNLLYNKGSSQ